MSSSAEAVSIAKEPTPTWALYRALVGVAAVSGILIVFVYGATLPRIKKNKAEALRKAVYQVIPGAEQVKVFTPSKEGGLKLMQEPDEEATIYYAGYDSQGLLQGVAVPAEGQGFADKIKVLFGYSPLRQEIIGLKVLESKETPGLGDQIEKDKSFTKQFKDLDVKLDTGGQNLVNRIKVVKAGQRQNRWEIAAITGATISSKALGNILDGATQAHVPRLYSNKQELEDSGAGK